MWNHPEPHPGAWLNERFLKPLGLTASDLARGCRMPRSRVSDLLAGKRGISADTAQRLGAFFRMDPEVWMALQAAWDLDQTPTDPEIAPLDPPGFLLGPAGATPLPPRRRPSPPALHLPQGPSGPAEREQRRVRRHEEVCYPDGTRALISVPR
ncbi:MAG: HigA family addiction module antidote protein [Alphaproteobacteria bacterium]|nr:HigA family addiction module antidote protein [Alphaproteobacteria bacterium]